MNCPEASLRGINIKHSFDSPQGPGNLNVRQVIPTRSLDSASAEQLQRLRKLGIPAWPSGRSSTLLFQFAIAHKKDPGTGRTMPGVYLSVHILASQYCIFSSGHKSKPNQNEKQVYSYTLIGNKLAVQLKCTGKASISIRNDHVPSS